MAMKFNFGKLKDFGKEAGKSVLGDLGNVGLITAGAIGSKKFLDLGKVLESMKLGNDHWAIQHQGALKVGIGIVALTAFHKQFKKSPWMSMLIYGMMLEGGLTEFRKLSTQKDGSNFFEPIGNGNDYQLLPPVTQQYTPSVAAGIKEELFDSNSYNSVAGVTGDDEDEDY